MVRRQLLERRKKHMRNIICKLLHYEQEKTPTAATAIIELKVELWKLLRQIGSKRIMTQILIELDNELDPGAKPLIYRLSEEFELHIGAFENFKSSVKNSISDTTAPDLDKKGVDKVKDLETIMEDNTLEPTWNSNFLENGASTGKSSVNDFQTDFIPLVNKNNAENDPSILALLEGHDMEFLMEFLDLEDFEINPYEAIINKLAEEKKDSNPAKRETIEASFLNIDFLPLIHEVEEEKEVIEPLVDILDMEVDCEVVIDPYVKKQISDMLKSHVREQIQEDTIIIENDILDLGRMQLPVAKFYSERESKRVKLLHAIAELGDIREVPLLNEMMDVEENESIAKLIKEIIFKFLFEYPEDQYDQEKYSANLDYGNHYVFNRLFNALDMESQLILLEEIEQVGEQHDLSFLETLHIHPIRLIREKAKSVSTSLKNKLHGPGMDLTANPINSQQDKNIPSEPWVEQTTNKNNTQTPWAIKSGALKTFQNNKNTTYRGAKEENNIFQIDFELAPSENLIDSRGLQCSKDTYINELEEMHFLEQLKELTHKIFKR